MRRRVVRKGAWQRVGPPRVGGARNTRLLVSPLVLAEADYLLSVRDRRPDVSLAVLRYVARGAYLLARIIHESVPEKLSGVPGGEMETYFGQQLAYPAADLYEE